MLCFVCEVEYGVSIITSNVAISNIQNGKSIYLINYATSGAYGDIAFVRFKDDKDFYVIKVQKNNDIVGNDNNPSGCSYLHQEIFMLIFLNKKTALKHAPIMGFNYAFKSISTGEGILYNPVNFTPSPDVVLSNCLISKAEPNGELFSSHLNNINDWETKVSQNVLLKLETFIKEIFEMREFINQDGFCHNDLRLDNIMLSNDKLILIDFGAAYSDIVDSIYDDEVIIIVKKIYDLLPPDVSSTKTTKTIKSEELFNNSRTNCNGPYAYKNIKGNHHNLWADFACLIKDCTEKYPQCFANILDQYPFINICIAWFDEFSKLYIDIFNKPPTINKGLILGSDYINFMNSCPLCSIKTRIIALENTTEEMKTLMNIYMKDPIYIIGGRRKLKLCDSVCQKYIHLKDIYELKNKYVPTSKSV